MASAAVQIVGLLVILGVADTGVGEVVNALAAALCAYLTVFEVLNNPAGRENF